MQQNYLGNPAIEPNYLDSIVIDNTQGPFDCHFNQLRFQICLIQGFPHSTSGLNQPFFQIGSNINQGGLSGSWFISNWFNEFPTLPADWINPSFKSDQTSIKEAWAGLDSLVIDNTMNQTLIKEACFKRVSICQARTVWLPLESTLVSGAFDSMSSPFYQRIVSNGPSQTGFTLNQTMFNKTLNTDEG